MTGGGERGDRQPSQRHAFEPPQRQQHDRDHKAARHPAALQDAG
jgi:hypothetical protein